jgi:hypothetical protein
MSIGSSSWVSIEPQIIDRVVAGNHEHFAETDVTVQILTGIGTLEAFGGSGSLQALHRVFRIFLGFNYYSHMYEL